MHDGSDDSLFRLSERRKRDEDGRDPPWEGRHNGGVAERGIQREKEKEGKKRRGSRETYTECNTARGVLYTHARA